MIGIFGVVDLRGGGSAISPGSVESFRGVAAVEVMERVSLGVFCPEGHVRPFLRSEDSLLVADASIHGVVDTTTGWKPSGEPSLCWFEEVLDRPVEDLLSIAADFAVARFDRRRGRLTLARDAFGLRPLYWVRTTDRFAFASDPEVLQQLDMTALDLDADTVTAFLARREVPDDRTPFDGVFTVLPGHVLSVGDDAVVRTRRWFSPESLITRRLAGSKAVEATREAVIVATDARSRGRRTGLLLSSGRDSGSLAFALRDAGLDALCITQAFDPDLEDVNEGEAARALAHAAGHDWAEARIPSSLDHQSYRTVPDWSGTPCACLAFPQATSPVEVAAHEGVEVLLGGEGGEPLFSAGPIAVHDLLLQGHLRRAVRAARVFDHEWTYPYSSLAKAAARAHVPRGMLDVRERIRPMPPWIARPFRPRLDPITAPSSDRDYLVTSLRNQGGTAYDVEERLHAWHGIEMAYPLLDLRVVQVALSVGLLERVPVPDPKPLLAAAFLGAFRESRRKVTFQPYYRRFAERTWRSMPDVFEANSALVRAGYVDAAAVQRHRAAWPIESLALTPVAMWLDRYG